MIDRQSDRAAFRQLADLLRDQIADGTLPAGRRIPSETTLSQRYGLSRNTVRQAVRLLAAEGLLLVSPPAGTFVADRDQVETVTIGPGDEVTYRGTGGTAVISRAAGAVETYPAASVRITAG